MPLTPEEVEEILANRRALEEAEAQKSYLEKRRRGRHIKKLGVKAKKQKGQYRKPSREQKKRVAYEAKRVFPEARHHPSEPPGCDMLSTGQGRRLVEQHLLINYTEHHGHSSLVCEEAGDLIGSSIGGCPGNSRPYALLESAPDMVDHGLEFHDVARVTRMDVPNYCSIDSDKRFMACALVRGRLNDDQATGEEMRMRALERERLVLPRDEYQYRKRRLMDEYNIGICEVRL